MELNFVEKNMELQKLTGKYVGELTKIWTRIFAPEICKENLFKLISHAKNFYQDLVDESLQKETYIQKEIQDLYEEASMMQRLLKLDVNVLPSPQNNSETPLLLIQSDMDKRLTDLREQIRQRRAEICELLLEQDTLCGALGEEPLPLVDDPLPSSEELAQFRHHLEQLKLERMKRMNEMTSVRREIRSALQVLEIQVNTEKEAELLNDREMKVQKETFAELLEMRSRYVSQVEELHQQIDEMELKLETLWERLQTPSSTREKFKRLKGERNQHTYDVFYSELKRCETQKSENMKMYIEQIRSEISQLWDKLLVSEKERNRFSNFHTKNYTDDLLVLHEMELDDLKKFYETNRHIYELYEERKMLWDRMDALESKAMDPGRYNNRGGQLLREEKERKTIATKLPKIEQEIAELAQAFELREHKPFLIHGENILQLMAVQWEQRRQEKEKLSSARKNVRTPLVKTQTTLAMAGRTPKSLKNVSTAASMRRTPSSVAGAASSSARLQLAKMPSTTAQKRKLHPTEKHTPLAKRSLMHVLNSPSYANNNPSSTIQQLRTKRAADQRENTANSRLAFKTPTKPKAPQRVIGSLLRRRSGRKSINNSLKGGRRSIPKILINSTSADQDDDTYDSFEKCIEPSSRSSTILCNTTHHNMGVSTRSKRLVPNGGPGNTPHAAKTKLAKLPDPRDWLNTAAAAASGVKPSRQANLHQPTQHQLHTSSSSSHYRNSPTHSVSASGRKLTTKNLPIII